MAASAAERTVTQKMRDGKRILEMSGARFLRDWSFGHFYFHVVTAYDILRHEGLTIGKPDFLNHVGDAMKTVQ